MAVPADALPKPAVRPADPKADRERIRSLQQAVRAVASQANLPPELIASRRLLSAALHLWHDGKPASTLPALDGWRRTLIGETLDRLLPDHQRPER